MAPQVQEIHFSKLNNIPVTIVQKIPVFPANPMPVTNGNTLYLSNLDDMIGTRVFTPTIYFYRCNSKSFQKQSIFNVLCDALANVLVPYYPFSGRLKEIENGKLEVFFEQGQGALMVEAQSERSLADLGDLTVPNPAWNPLIYKFPNEEPYKIINMPLVIGQVTMFTCGGFSLGLRLCHCICDGLGAMQFLDAWAATAKLGSLVTNPKPCWEREFFKPRNPPLIKYPHVEFKRTKDGSSLTRTLWEGMPVQRCYKIDQKFQARLKFLAQTGTSPCSTFDAMAAHIWRSWVKALDVKPLDYELRLTFSVNARPKLKNPPLKDGFYGNVVCVACAVSTVSNLVNGKLSDISSLIYKARLGASEEYLRSTIDYVEVNRPTRLEFGGKLTITQWTRFSMYESADFGWGRPTYAGPIDLTPTPQVCVFLPEGQSDPNGKMIAWLCLPKLAAQKFAESFCQID